MTKHSSASNVCIDTLLKFLVWTLKYLPYYKTLPDFCKKRIFFNALHCVYRFKHCIFKYIGQAPWWIIICTIANWYAFIASLPVSTYYFIKLLYLFHHLLLNTIFYNWFLLNNTFSISGVSRLVLLLWWLWGQKLLPQCVRSYNNSFKLILEETGKKTQKIASSVYWAF